MVILELVKILAYFRALQMVTTWSKAMAKSTDDSIMVNTCRNKIYMTHSLKPKILVLSQKTSSVVLFETT